MKQMGFDPLRLEGLALIQPLENSDKRGYFCKYFDKEIWEREGISFAVSENFVSFSQKHVLRGLHIQVPNPQAKLVSVLYGEIYDVGVDLRRGSATYGQWEGVTLSHENRQGLYLPEGFAHGFLVRSDFALVSYLCAGAYEPEGDGGIFWNDAQIGIDWGFAAGEQPILSQRDAALPLLAEYERRQGI